MVTIQVFHTPGCPENNQFAFLGERHFELTLIVKIKGQRIMIKIFKPTIGPWSKRYKLIAARWRDILLYGVLGAAAVWLVAIPSSPYLAKKLAFLGATGQLVLAILTLLVVLYLIVKLSLFRANYLKNIHFHPPILLSAILGFSALLALQGYPAYVFAGLTVLFLFDLCLFLGFRQQSELKAEKPEALTLSGGDIGSWGTETIQKWMAVESPVSDGEGLLFDRQAYVERIYNRLFFLPDSGSGEIISDSREAKTLALLGGLGSGKSSILNVLLNNLKERQPDWLVFTVDSWERDANTIDEQILEVVIDTLSEHIDVTGYRSLPSAYHDALKSHGSWWAALSYLVAGEVQAQNKLTGIFNVLEQLNKKLLIIIEDPDRGVQHEQDKTTPFWWSY